MTDTSRTTETTELRPDTDGSESDLDLPLEFNPTLKPLMIWLALTVLVGATILGYLIANPELFGERDLTEIVSWVVAFVLTLVILRLVVKMYILKRMTYRITPTELHREYELFYRYTSRRIPLRRIRGVELSRDRIQSLLGYGDLAFLTGGTNQSLGFVEFENVDNTDEIRDVIFEVTSELVKMQAAEDQPEKVQSASVD